MAVTSRGKQQAAPDAAELAELRAALQAVARVTANVAARAARTQSTDFQLLLTGSTRTHADASCSARSSPGG